MRKIYDTLMTLFFAALLVIFFGCLFILGMYIGTWILF